jgi:1-deoxy-D-xylulose-5-phosphate reductoisomerase
MKRIAILGSTGSVGTQALQLIAARPADFRVVGLAARRSAGALEQQARALGPAAVCLVDGNGAPPRWPGATAWFEGRDGVLQVLEHSRPELVLNAITGAAGLEASEWCLRHAVPLALANKESLVMAGAHLMELSRQTGTPLLPVDSEHCAIFQCLEGQDRRRVRRVWITGSGGPFRNHPIDTFAQIEPAQALRHPTWDMGPRITVGSATMMNKAFEVIEAHWLFGLAPEQIEVLIHPQSIVHSMVEFEDGNLLAQLGVPDMRVPILYCLSYPHRAALDFQPFDPVRFAQLTFEPVDPRRYPAVQLAYETLRAGGDAGAVLNAADEVLTGLFLQGQVLFPAIAATVAAVLRAHRPAPIQRLADVLEADRRARRSAEDLAAALPAPKSAPA